MNRFSIFITSIFSLTALAQSCPSGDDPVLVQKMNDKLSVILCGFEDHEFPEEQGQRAFSDFKIFAFGGPKPKPTMLFSAAEGDTYLVRAQAKGVTLTEVWEIGDKSIPTISRELACEGDSCKLLDSACVAKFPKNPFASALADLQTMMKKGKLKPDAEDLIDRVFAQALGGDKAAGQFFSAGKVPKEFEGANAEAFGLAQKRLELASKSKCLESSTL